MAKNNFNSCENILISVAGHLLVVAIMITSVAVVIERAEKVTPDRIEIVEIDLKNVRIGGNETKLYNVESPQKTEQQQPEKTTEPTTKPEIVPDKKPIDSTELVDEQQPKENKQDNNSGDNTKKSPTPKKKTVVRVNRETMSLDRTLTISVVDALRVAMTRCWVIDTNRPDIADIRAVAHLKMNKNGTVADVWFESESRAEQDAAFAYVLDTIRSAIHNCEPFSMLPENEYSKWQNIQLTFYPTQGKVM